MAERLELIPDVNIVEVSKRVADKLLQGQELVIDSGGASDTIRYHWKADGLVVEKYAGLDEYGRGLAEYSILLNDPWTSF
jgi:hypothetical protein